MDREKEIEEIAVILTDGGCTKCNCDENGKFNCLPMYSAELLYNVGYRKQSEVAMEIIGEILSSHTLDIDGFFTMHESELTELKKKYTEESGNDR